jgi:hypothetical protein
MIAVPSLSAIVLVTMKSPIINDSKLPIRDSHMKDHTQTLQIASPAPGFRLTAANREGTSSLSDLLSRGPLILEFLRGTW